jgi:hypothetical protein
MIVYIVWKTQSNDEDLLYILGIYTKMSTALKNCNKYNKDIVTKKADILTSDNGLISNFSTVPDENTYYCTKHVTDDDDCELFFLTIFENGGHGSYFREFSIYTSPYIDGLIEIATDRFSAEHNRDADCKNCIKGKCKKKFIRSLKKNNNSQIDCNGHAYFSFEISSALID